MMKIDNLALYKDVVRITTNDGSLISVERGADGTVYVYIFEDLQGSVPSVYRTILGKSGVETLGVKK
jgi:hypothetical protein